MNIPKSDFAYTYTSLVVFVVSLVSAWKGYTLLSVQLLIWWVMQLTCILTITCLRGWLKGIATRKGYENMDIRKTWLFDLIYKVILPTLGVYSFIIAIYWAADVFNLSDTTLAIFKKNYIETKGFSASIFSLAQVIVLFYLFAYFLMFLKNNFNFSIFLSLKIKYKISLYDNILT